MYDPVSSFCQPATRCLLFCKIAGKPEMGRPEIINTPIKLDLGIKKNKKRWFLACILMFITTDIGICFFKSDYLNLTTHWIKNL